MALTQKGTRVTFSGTATPSVTFPGSCTSGSTLLAECSWEAPLQTLNQVADATNGNYTLLAVGNSGNNGSAGDGACRLGYFLTNTATTALTVNFTLSSGVDGVINCYEIPASTLDKHAENGGTSSSAGVTIVGAAANAFLLAATHRRFGGAGVDAGISGISDYMDVGVNSGNHSAQYSNNAGSAGNKQVDFNDTTSQPAWATAAATFVAAGGGGGNTIAVPAGSLTLSAQTPTVITTANNQIAVPLATLTLAAQTPTVIATANQLIAVPAGSLALNAFAPSVLNGVTIAVPAGALTLTGLTPMVLSTANIVIDVPFASLSMTAFAPTILGSAQGSSGGFFYDFGEHISQRRKKQQALAESRDAEESIEQEIDRSIAHLLHAQESKDEERKDIERIRALVQQHKDSAIDVDSERVLKAVDEAKEKQTRASLEKLQREFERMLEEEEHAVLMLLLND